MAIEVELKLQLNPRHIARLRNHPLLKHPASPSSRKLYTVYYDTRDLQLWRRGIALRLRRDGKRWIQTIKTGGNVTAGMHNRDEYEVEVSSRLPDFSVIDSEMAS